MINRLSAKLGLFAAVWYELTVEGGLGPGVAFFATLVLTFLSSAALQMIGFAMQLAGPGVVSVAAHGLAWFILFWWLAPAALWHLPLLYDAGALLLIGLASAKSRQLLALRRMQLALAQPRYRFPAILFLVMAGVAACMLALHVWGSLWPLVGWALLLLIPFRVGWQWAPPVTPDRADAKMGERSTFEDAGWSAER